MSSLPTTGNSHSFCTSAANGASSAGVLNASSAPVGGTMATPSWARAVALALGMLLSVLFVVATTVPEACVGPAEVSGAFVEACTRFLPVDVGNSEAMQVFVIMGIAASTGRIVST
ncbi:unnamed protein product [Prorocentrum cordatum]|uniref:Uncharacterized protein n=1 Tax=Prorocentrum cordatum TaxID=2364126 RepID=A0ABN9V7M7_9DINO|nr:unnamed protein product [Polarella glacialis]|mmetsp:Transcript_61688/g.160220  ORF Transcript_61688/g.160220 Transcript_61688/m.160220 type:complete len:116 (-) Transcript_61688:37-384(-)